MVVAAPAAAGSDAVVAPWLFWRLSFRVVATVGMEQKQASSAMNVQLAPSVEWAAMR